jgi:AbrB family looped-hinge helix DNA binding protein
METIVTSKGQVTIPKHIRDSRNIQPGCRVYFEVNSDGDTVLRKCGPVEELGPDRFDEVAGTADIKWRTDELMALLSVARTDGVRRYQRAGGCAGARSAMTYSSSAILDEKIATMNLIFEQIPRGAAFLAGKVHMVYRRQGGAKGNVLSAFFIGAHAAVLGCPRHTRDTRRYRAYFPQVRLIAPAPDLC